jgi:hypothetical protein
VLDDICAAVSPPQPPSLREGGAVDPSRLLFTLAPPHAVRGLGGEIAATTSSSDVTCQFIKVGHLVCSRRRHGGRRRSAIDARTTSRPGYAISQRARKRVEEIFGWMKAIGGFRRTRFRGLERTQLAGYFVGAAYNLLRIARLVAA